MKRQKPKPDLSPKQFGVLGAVYQLQNNRPYSATIAEVAEKLQLSKTTAFEHIAALREKGLLEKPSGKYRCLKLTKQGYAFAKQSRPPENDFVGNTEQLNGSGIALLGKVAAGRPIEAVENQQVLNLTEKFSEDNVFALEVSGNSMIDDDIRSGDWVICKKTQTANNGQLAVVIVDDNTATLKRFYREKNFARLQPANADFQPIITNNCRIEAVVVGLVRKF